MTCVIPQQVNICLCDTYCIIWMLLHVASTKDLPEQFKAGTLVALYDAIHGGTGHNGTGGGSQTLFLLFVNTKLQIPKNVTSNYQLTVVVQIGVCLTTPLGSLYSLLYSSSMICECTHLCNHHCGSSLYVTVLRSSVLIPAISFAGIHSQSHIHRKSMVMIPRSICRS
jgi:hypothetical protein